MDGGHSGCLVLISRGSCGFLGGSVASWRAPDFFLRSVVLSFGAKGKPLPDFVEILGPPVVPFYLFVWGGFPY